MTTPKAKRKPKLNQFQQTTLRSFMNIARRRMEARGLLIGERSPIKDARRLLNDEETYVSGTIMEKYTKLMKELDPNGQRHT